MLELQKKKHRHTIAPVRIICGSFLAIILVGALLLMLPISSKAGIVTSPLDCLFTATSATCVTGLVVYDTFLHWTAFGQSVIICLIQLGGLGVLSFTTFFTLSFRRKLGLRDMRLAGEQINFGSMVGIQPMLYTILKVTFLCEGVGAFLLCLRFVPMFGAWGIYAAVFVAVSAYCNAGFDVFGGYGGEFANLSVFSGDWLVLGVLGILIILGGLGFIVFSDVLAYRRQGEKRHRLTLHSKAVLITTAALVVGGTILILLLEHGRTLQGKPFGDQVIDSFFSSVTARTAGFNVLNYADTHALTRTLTCILMFIGASPGSTGGGVKTSTIFVLIATVYSVLRGYDDTTIMRKRVERSTVYKAIALVFFSILLVMVAGVILVICDGDRYSELNLLFEVISAFSTTGLSAIGSGNLSDISKAVLILLMYIGRVGPISFILTLSRQNKERDNSMTLPEGKIMVG